MKPVEEIAEHYALVFNQSYMNCGLSGRQMDALNELISQAITAEREAAEAREAVYVEALEDMIATITTPALNWSGLHPAVRQELLESASRSKDALSSPSTRTKEILNLVEAAKAVYQLQQNAELMTATEVNTIQTVFFSAAKPFIHIGEK